MLSQHFMIFWNLQLWLTTHLQEAISKTRRSTIEGKVVQFDITEIPTPLSISKLIKDGKSVSSGAV
jgi:ubiquinone biosynthesis protein UbiJ